VISTNKTATTLAVIFVLLASVFILDSFSWSLVYRTSYGSLDSTPRQNESDDINKHDNKIVILTFGNAPKSQYIYAKPILDMFDFKGSFFIVCNWIESEEGFNMKEPRMTWEETKTLHEEGHDIQAKSLNHERLTEVSSEELEHEVGKPKDCLSEQDIDVNIFGTPYGDGKDNASVISTISKHYDFAITGFSDLMFLDCDGWKESSSLPSQPDCRTYYDNGTLTPVNRYSIRESSQDSLNRKYQGNNTKIFEEFVNEVNSQDDFNKDGIIRTIPIIAYHDFKGNRFTDSTSGISSDNDDDSTDANLFKAEMRYLYENGFKVITMADLGYDEENHRLYVRELL
jgi:peptidoglycan/xylan/chitin deacetylase (PgdA/CDA1 family)